MILVPPLGAGSCGRDFVCMIMLVEAHSPLRSHRRATSPITKAVPIRTYRNITTFQGLIICSYVLGLRGSSCNYFPPLLYPVCTDLNQPDRLFTSCQKTKHSLADSRFARFRGQRLARLRCFQKVMMLITGLRGLMQGAVANVSRAPCSCWRGKWR